MYQVELIWNGEFNFIPYGDPKESLPQAIKFAREMENSGDGARVKKTRIYVVETGEYIMSYQYQKHLTTQ